MSGNREPLTSSRLKQLAAIAERRADNNHMAELTLLVCSIIAIIASLRGSPQLATWVLVPALPLQTIRYRFQDYPLGSSYIDIMLLAIFIGVLLRREQPILPQHRIYKVLVVLSGFLYLSLWQGALFQKLPLPLWFTDERFSDWKNLVVLPLIFVAVLASIRTQKEMKILLALMCVSLVAVDKGFGNTFTASQITHFAYEGRQGGPFGYAGINGIAAFFAQIILFLLGYMAFEKSLWIKTAIIGILAYTSFNLVYTFSRGAYIALILGLLVFGFLKQRRYLVFVSILLFTWQTIVPQAVVERITTTYDSTDGDLEASAQERVQLWTDAEEVILHSPLFGSGFDTYKYMGRVGNLHLRDTHNYYLKVLLETGIAGLCCFLYLLTMLFGIAWTLYRSTEDRFYRGLSLGLLLWLSAALITIFFGDRWTYIEITGYMWALLAMAVRATSMLIPVDLKLEHNTTEGSYLEQPLTLSAAGECQ